MSSKLLVCRHCDKAKLLSDFYWRNGRPRVSEGCKECFCILTNSSGRSTRPEAVARVKARNEATLEKAESHRQRWTSEDESLLEQNYSDPETSLEDLAETLGRERCPQC